MRIEHICIGEGCRTKFGKDSRKCRTCIYAIYTARDIQRKAGVFAVEVTKCNVVYWRCEGQWRTAVSPADKGLKFLETVKDTLVSLLKADKWTV